VTSHVRGEAARPVGAAQGARGGPGSKPLSARDLTAGLAVTPIPDERDRYTHGTVVLDEVWAAIAICCEPGCRWRETDKSRGGADPGVRAKRHAELRGHQTLLVWHAADRYLPDPNTSPIAPARTEAAHPSHSQPRGRPDAHPDPTSSRNTTARRTK